MRSHEDWNFNSFQLVVPGPGEFMKATHALEASIKIHPTVMLTNALPYHMDGYILAVPNVAMSSHSILPTGSIPPVFANRAPHPRSTLSADALSTPPNFAPMAGVYRRLSVTTGSQASGSNGGDHLESGDHSVEVAAQKEEQVRLGFEVLMKLEALMVLLKKKVRNLSLAQVQTLRSAPTCCCRTTADFASKLGLKTSVEVNRHSSNTSVCDKGEDQGCSHKSGSTSYLLDSHCHRSGEVSEPNAVFLSFWCMVPIYTSFSTCAHKLR